MDVPGVIWAWVDTGIAGFCVVKLAISFFSTLTIKSLTCRPIDVILTSHFGANDMTENLATLQAQLAKLNRDIEIQKALDKLQKCPVRARTMPKYLDLQKAYVDACKGG